MKDYTEYTDLDAADAANPNGAIKEGATSGTLLNKTSWNDLFQTLMYCKRVWVAAGNTVNNLYDTVYNTYQMFEAIKYAVNSGDWTEITAFGSNSQSSGSTYNKLNVRKKGDIVEIAGAFNYTTGDAFTIPSGFRPSKTVTIQCQALGAVPQTKTATIGTDGIVTLEPAASGTLVGIISFSTQYTTSELI